VTLHDAERVLNPALLDCQVHGGFAMAVGAAFYERLVYAEDGGNSMSTRVCIAYAVADALGVVEVSLPLTPERLLEMVRRRGQ